MAKATAKWVPTSSLTVKPPFSELFTMADETLAEVTKSMKAEGFDAAHPLSTWKGIVLDGHTRHKAALAAGLNKVLAVAHTCKNEAEAEGYAIECQTQRRNLEKVEVTRCIRAYEQRLKEAGYTPSKGGRHKHNKEAAEKVLGKAVIDKDGNTQSVVARIGEKVGTSSALVSRLRAITERGGKRLNAQVVSGALSISAAHTQLLARERLREARKAFSGVKGPLLDALRGSKLWQDALVLEDLHALPVADERDRLSVVTILVVGQSETVEGAARLVRLSELQAQGGEIGKAATKLAEGDADTNMPTPAELFASEYAATLATVKRSWGAEIQTAIALQLQHDCPHCGKKIGD